MPQINIAIDINESIYLRDPLQTSLGKRIIEHAIILLHESGYEELTFKKLAASMESTEASVYRYFKNKHKLLTYLVAWYWDFMHFMILMDVRNITDPKLKLDTAISTLVNSLDSTITPSYIDQAKLHTIVVENASKVYHTRDVDNQNKDGHYGNYKKIVKTLADMITDIDKKFAYPIALATNAIELSLTNEYYIEHLPSLTDSISPKDDPGERTIDMISYLLGRIMK